MGKVYSIVDFLENKIVNFTKNSESFDSQSIKELVKDIAKIVSYWIKAKAEKTSTENAKLRAETELKFAEAKKCLAEADKAEAEARKIQAEGIGIEIANHKSLMKSAEFIKEN